MKRITYASQVKSALKGAGHVAVIAKGSRCKAGTWPNVLGGDLDEWLVTLASGVGAGDLGGHASTLTSSKTGANAVKLTVTVLPETVSRYNSAASPEGVRRGASVVAGTTGKSALILVLEDTAHMLAAINAVSRALPLYSSKTSGKAQTDSHEVSVICVDARGEVMSVPGWIREVADGAREAAALVDTPPSELEPAEFATRAKAHLRGLVGVKIKEIVGPQLVEQGLRGIYSVGKGASVAPRMLVATYRPARAAKSAEHFALVGKGVCYDTGGLHLKPRGGMEGMKGDMGGAAAVLGAFRVLAGNKFPHHLSLVLCLAENAIGPEAYKPDDIITLHSGKTVEINNTDAEGRLLLADGVSYAARVLKATTIVDAATLTGAQLMATGTMHAAVFSNDEALESELVQASYDSGDLAHPLMFAPEFYKSEFPSHVADMTNTVRNRMNAQSSCAAQFIYWHIEDQGVRWAHIDLAGPSFVRGRGTGYGVALLAELGLRLGRKKSEKV